MYNIDSVQSAITILTHFESTNKYDNIRDYSTRSFYTCLYIACWILSLTTIINSCYYYIRVLQYTGKFTGFGPRQHLGESARLLDLEAYKTKQNNLAHNV